MDQVLKIIQVERMTGEIEWVEVSTVTRQGFHSMNEGDPSRDTVMECDRSYPLCTPMAYRGCLRQCTLES